MVYCPRSAQSRRGARAICLQATVLTSDRAYMINRLAAEAPSFIVLPPCIERGKRTRCPRAFIRTLFHGGSTTRRGRFLPNKPNGRNALSVKELSVRLLHTQFFPLLLL